MESRKGRRKIPAWFWENICNLWLVIVYFTEIMIQQFFPAPRRGLNLGLQFFPGLKPRAEFYRPCGTVLFADMICYTYCLFMEIWQNHFLKKQFSSDQTWRKYLFFEKLWDICVKIDKNISFKRKNCCEKLNFFRLSAILCQTALFTDNGVRGYVWSITNNLKE